MLQADMLAYYHRYQLPSHNIKMEPKSLSIFMNFSIFPATVPFAKMFTFSFTLLPLSTGLNNILMYSDDIG